MQCPWGYVQSQTDMCIGPQKLPLTKTLRLDRLVVTFGDLRVVIVVGELGIKHSRQGIRRQKTTASVLIHLRWFFWVVGDFRSLSGNH